MPLNLWWEELGVRWGIGDFRAIGCVCSCPHARDEPYLPQTLQGTHRSQTILPSPHRSLILLPHPGHGAQASLTCSAVDELGDIVSLSAGQLVGFPAGFPPSEVTLGCCRWSRVPLSLLSREEASSRAALPLSSHPLCLFLSVLTHQPG